MDQSGTVESAELVARGGSRFGSASAAAGLTALAAGAGGLATRRGLEVWYRALRKPPYNPPDAVFGPVWTALYTLIAASGYRVMRAPPSPARNRALALWLSQLGLNAGWSWLFFAGRRKRAALVELVGLLGAAGGYALAARRVDRAASWLVAPYLAWSGFATVLNAEIVRRNP